MTETPEGVARQVRVWKKRRGLTTQQLADRLKGRGGKLSRQAISKIENGDRRVTVDELVLLALALEVPPILLALPLGTERAVQVLPGQEVVPTWEAAKWWAGEQPFPGDENGEAWEARAAVVGYFRDHDDLERTFRSNRQERPDQARWYAERLSDLRKNMRRAGVLPPELPPDMSYMDWIDPDSTEEGNRGDDQEG